MAAASDPLNSSPLAQPERPGGPVGRRQGVRPFLLAILAGALAAGSVWAWPAGPVWRTRPDVGRLQSFSPDGRVVVTTHVPPQVGGRSANPTMSRWDAATGELLSRVELPCADPTALYAVRPSADGLQALVGEGQPTDRTRADFSTGQWYLHDGTTGQRRQGPIPGVAQVNTFSPDGRWFVAQRGDPQGGWDGLRHLVVCSADTGAPVLDLSDRDGWAAKGCLFAPDGDRAVIVWRPVGKPEGPARHVVQVIDLPSGAERRRVELPPRSWLGVHQWDGRNLEAVFETPDGATGQNLRCGYILDLSRDPIGDGVEDPLLCHRWTDGNGPVYWAAGPGWVAYYHTLRGGVPGSRLQAGWEWVVARLGLRQAAVPGPPRARVWFVDRATGTTRYEVPEPVGLTFNFAPDGRRLACTTADGGIAVWDTDPPPRWPRTLAAGVVVAAGVFGLSRWWRPGRKKG